MSTFSGWSDFPVEMRDSDLRKSGEGRPEGLHLGEVIRSMRLAVDPKASLSGSDILCMQEGFIWESAVEYMRAGMVLDDALQLAFKRYMCELNKGLVTQISLQKDGIWMTPDAYDPEAGEIHSYKHTRRSLKKALDAESFQREFWTWMVAEKAYCLAASCDTVRFVVLWAAGDYSRGLGTPARALQCTIKWSVDELLENWKNVLIHAEGCRGNGTH